jgi:predicted nuclease of predicted toxin-antitoxin system
VAERIRLYTDEHIPRAVVRGLRERGVDTLTVSEAGMLGASDEEHLAYALREGRVLFTQDDDKGSNGICNGQGDRISGR